jgi:sn-glycerol 3-phosphate transport system substrate-binding protein
MSQRSMTRREMLKFMTIGGGAAVLAACGAAPAAEPTAEPAAEATSAPAVVTETGSTVNITYWGSFSGGLGEAETALVEQFNDSQTRLSLNTSSRAATKTRRRSSPPVCRPTPFLT